MRGLKDNGIAVIAMKDFLAWRQAEKNIPPRSCIITIDDGYVSGLQRCLADLKTVRLHYLCTIFIYTNYVNAGGKSITWAQLEEMRDAGVDIESLTVSHHDLDTPRRDRITTPCCTMRSTPPSGSWKTN
jgi:peptidoglycan/xylan/chitin deacetylase (PgdA/CDA1 family)